LDKQDILERLDFYREAPPELQSTISAAARYVKLAAGDHLFTEGDASNEFAAVGVGSIRVFRIGATGREITLYHVRSQESSLVSMLAVLLGRPVIATGQAEEERCDQPLARPRRDARRSRPPAVGLAARNHLEPAHPSEIGPESPRESFAACPNAGRHLPAGVEANPVDRLDQANRACNAPA
jgi:hypothetical protein